MGSEIIKNITQRRFSQHDFATSRNLIKPVGFWVFQNAKTRCENPYKTCWILRHSEPKIENGPRNNQKSITQRRFSQHQFKTSENLIKPDEFWVFQNAKTRCVNPYKTCRKWRLRGPFFANGPKIIKKHYLEKVSATRFQNVEKPYRTCRISRFSKCKKRVAETLIKPDEFKYFLPPFAGMAPKMIKKH